MKFIQSFYRYPVTYASIGKGIPSLDADGPTKNIVELSDEEVATLEEKEQAFRDLVRQKKYRILDHLPESYKPANQVINEARAEAKAAKDEVARLKALLAQAEAKAAAAEEKPEAKAAPPKKKA